MRIDINGHQIEVTPALHDYVHDKLARVARHFDHHRGESAARTDTFG